MAGKGDPSSENMIDTANLKHHSERTATKLGQDQDQHPEIKIKEGERKGTRISWLGNDEDSERSKPGKVGK
ncbi:hypothetical protein K0M31_015480 [Melipona bicolor]|uniref:Uncharacterized protein n=1 Tax=Melipona bicolor TaxID=60889 RepID=A0AA40FFE7_9HYME|nr:hypothetical protein K0M31_015480 [Melipona bicolor]